MAIDAAVMAPARWSPRTQWSVADSAFALFLLLVFVGLSPFATRDPVALATGQGGGSGDLTRQVAYAGTFLFIVVAAIRTRGMGIRGSIPPILVVLLAWCVLSAVWAPAPDVAFRRAVLESAIVMSAVLSVAMLGVERTLSLLRLVLGLVLLLNWLSIPLVHNAVHLPGEIDPQLVGDWRGLYFHKNIAGSVSAITAILFFFQALKTRAWLNGLVCIAAIGFTLMTHSKASLAFLPVAIAAGCLYRIGWQRGIDRVILTVAALIVASLLGILVFAEWGHISRTLTDPTELTGRTAIWQGEIAFIRDHFLLGSGFGSFSDTGAVSLLHNYVADTWVQNISQGHNGYLQILVTTGTIGFALAMTALVFLPAREFWRFDPANVAVRAVLFAIFVFMVLHNFLETDFLEGDDPAWVALVLAALRKLSPGNRKEPSRAAA